MSKTFILGVGCQKGGTSWLHRYLSGNPSADLGFVKEYHVFDALYLPLFESFMRRDLDAAKELFISGEIMNEKPNLLKKVDFYRSTSNYFDYFDYLWEKSDQTQIVGDITPSYSALPAKAYKEIKRGLEAKGFTVKVVFLMRDPLERIWSQIRMDIRNRKRRQNDDSELAHEDHDAVRSRFMTEGVEVRTRYDDTIRNLESVFAPEDIYYGFFETLFAEESVQQIAKFLGVDYVLPDLETKANASPKQSDLPLEIASEVVGFYSETYRYVFQKFGWEFMSGIWPNHRMDSKLIAP